MNWSIRKQAVLGLLTVIALFTGLAVFGFWGALAGAVVTTGRVEPESHNQVLQHPDGGVVKSIHVKDGDRVKAGELLLSLDGSDQLSELAILDRQLIELRARAARLQAEELGLDELVYAADLLSTAPTDPETEGVLDGQIAVFQAGRQSLADTTASYREQQRQIENEISGLRALGAALHEQTVLIETDLEAAEKLLERGLIQAPRVSDLKRVLAGLKGDMAQTEASIAARSVELSRLDVEVLRLTSSRRETALNTLRDVHGRISALQEQARTYQRRIDRLDLRAPSDGIVHGLKVFTIGGVILATDPVLSVIPQHDRFKVSAKIDANQIDSIYSGQSAVLRFTSFDRSNTPELNATVTRISAGLVADNRSDLESYIAELEVEPGDAGKLSELNLLPGMPVEVHIQTGARSPLSYILKPFLDYTQRAFRE